MHRTIPHPDAVKQSDAATSSMSPLLSSLHAGLGFKPAPHGPGRKFASAVQGPWGKEYVATKGDVLEAVLIFIKSLLHGSKAWWARARLLMADKAM